VANYRLLSVQVEPDPDAVEVRELRGRKHLVAPVVAVSEGVLNGGFLPFQEIAKSAPGWNGTPVTVNHPETDDGDFLPANDPAVLEQYQIGRFLGVEANDESKSLDGQLWIDLVQVKWLVENGGDLGDEAKQTVEMVRNAEKLEVSTGYWHGVVQESGEFSGHEFEAVQVELLPDHLAVLPNAEGACNWDGDSTQSGCGAPRANAVDVDGPIANAVDDRSPIAADGGVDAGDSKGLLANAGAKFADAIGLGASSDTATVPYDLPGAGSKQQTANQQNMGDNPSDRLETLANHSTFSVEELDAMDDETVDKIEASLEVDCGCGGSSNGGDGGDGGQDGTNNDGGDGGDTDDDDKHDAVLERLDQIEDRVDESQSRRREELIEAIEAQTRFEEDDLEDLGIAEDVDKLERFAEKQNAQVSTTPNYGGRAAGTQNDGDVDLDEVQVGGAFATMDAEAAEGGD